MHVDNTRQETSLALPHALMILSRDMPGQIDTQIILLWSKTGKKASLNKIFLHKINSRGKAGITACPLITLDHSICNIWIQNAKAAKKHSSGSSSTADEGVLFLWLQYITYSQILLKIASLFYFYLYTHLPSLNSLSMLFSPCYLASFFSSNTIFYHLNSRFFWFNI